MELKLCDVCGTENDTNAKFCIECGAKFQIEKMSKEKSQSSKVASEKKSKQKSQPDKKKEKSLTVNSTILAYTVLGLIILGGAMLYMSGVFDQPKATSFPQQSMEDFHSGVDLSKLQEINALRDRVANNPADHQSILHLAHLLGDSGFKEEAIKWYKQYLNDHGDEADVWVDMGVCYFDMNDFDNAISSMMKGVELNPRHQIAHFNLGIVNYTMNNLEKAVEWWNKAIQLNPASDIANKAKELINNHTNM
ncbi:MAG TPA: tetratricopeptide repeat protein [Ignavibacteria bacterium]|nr:tetratricopeptide repeat protein [Ignavibacteria bacterium]